VAEEWTVVVVVATVEDEVVAVAAHQVPPDRETGNAPSRIVATTTLPGGMNATDVKHRSQMMETVMVTQDTVGEVALVIVAVADQVDSEVVIVDVVVQAVSVEVIVAVEDLEDSVEEIVAEEGSVVVTVAEVTGEDMVAQTGDLAGTCEGRGGTAHTNHGSMEQINCQIDAGVLIMMCKNKHVLCNFKRIGRLWERERLKCCWERKTYIFCT